MLQLFYSFLGDNLRNFNIQLFIEMRFLICVFIYGRRLNKRRFFILRVAVTLAAFMAYCFAMAYLRDYMAHIPVRILFSFVEYGLPILPLLFLYQERGYTICITWCAAVATEEVGCALFSVIMFLCGADGRSALLPFTTTVYELDALIYFVFFTILCLICSRWFDRWQRVDNDKLLSKSITSLTLVVVITFCILRSLLIVFQEDAAVLALVVDLFSVGYAVLVLVLRHFILDGRAYRQELSVIEQILHEEKKQYESVKANIDVINMKCHDLKHFFTGLEGKLTDADIEALKSAVEIYDSSMKTGNEALDTVLYEKRLTSVKDGIAISCLADGKALDFINTVHIYSLFSNAMENAIEAVLKVPDPEKRLISVNVRRHAEDVEISVSNYFAETPALEDGVPSTSKEDRGRHGFGLKSIRYIAELYSGTVTVGTKGEIFTLSVLFSGKP